MGDLMCYGQITRLDQKPHRGAGRFMKSKDYERHLEPMLLELNSLARWLATTGRRIAVLLEGRDHRQAQPASGARGGAAQA